MLGTHSHAEQQCFLASEPSLTVSVQHFSETRGQCMSRRESFCPPDSNSQLCPVTVSFRECCCRMQECLTVGFWLEIDLGPVCINILMLSRRKMLSRGWFHTLELEYLLHTLAQLSSFERGGASPQGNTEFMVMLALFLWQTEHQKQ